MIDMPMPKVALGDDDEPAVVAAWLVEEGAQFDEGDPIIEVETAKANMEVEAPQDGVLVAALRAVGDEVRPGDVLAVLAEVGEEFDIEAVRAQRGVSAAQPTSAQEPGPTQEPVDAATIAETPTDLAAQPIPEPAAQSAPTPEAASGPAADVGRTGPSPTVDFREAGQLYGLPATNGRKPPAKREVRIDPGFEREPLSRHRRALASMMAKSAAIPQFSVHRELPMGEAQRAVQLLRTAGVPATLTDVVLRACAEALLRHPEANSQFIDGDCYRYHEPAIAVAADSPAGVVAPVIRGCASGSWIDLARERKRVVDGARNGRLMPADLSGATFSISNVGALGGDAVVPMLTPPQVAILGLGRVRPSWGGVVASGVLVADHRALDGADAARFLNSLAEVLDAIADGLWSTVTGVQR